jgi:hypothetical protein
MQIRLRPCVSSFDDIIGNHTSPVFLKHAFDKSTKFNVDFLQIDVEGRDYDVLKLINSDTLCPQCIHYEHCYLHQNELKAHKLLTYQGYTIFKKRAAWMFLLVELRPRKSLGSTLRREREAIAGFGPTMYTRCCEICVKSFKHTYRILPISN